MTSTQYGRSLDETEIERQVDFGELKIKFLMSAMVTGSNENNQVQVEKKRKMD